jgi:hypothetical protein
MPENDASYLLVLMTTENPYASPEGLTPLSTGGSGAKLRIRRTVSYADRLRAYHVHLDGRSIGTLNAGENCEFDIAPGSHSLEVRIDWCTSPLRMFQVKLGEKVEYECGSHLKGWKLLASIWYVAVARNKYLELKKVG